MLSDKVVMNDAKIIRCVEIQEKIEMKKRKKDEKNVKDFNAFFLKTDRL